MREYQHVKGVPLVVKDEATGGFRTIPYADRTDFDDELQPDADPATYDAFGIKFPTEQARQEALNDLDERQDTITEGLRVRDVDFMRPLGSTAATRVISPPSRVPMHAELDEEYMTKMRRT